jgi:two-component system cell cycle response regulator
MCTATATVKGWGMSDDDSREDLSDQNSTAVLPTPHALRAGSRDKACLLVLAGGPLGKVVAVGNRLTVGRSAEAGLSIPDEGLSRTHLHIERTASGTFRAVDAQSRNGTFINGQRIRESVLQDGDKICVGARTILRFSYIDDLDEAFQRQIYDEALRDPLTGLFNRRYLFAQLEAKFHLVRRHETPLTVVLTDIDYLELINDEHGHLVGDELLRAFAHYLKRTIRGSDFAARYGGEEFALVCHGVHGADAVKMAVRLQREIAAAALYPEVPDLRLTFSAGVASVPDPRIKDASALLDAADQALYAAKHSGRNRVIQYE